MKIQLNSYRPPTYSKFASKPTQTKSQETVASPDPILKKKITEIDFGSSGHDAYIAMQLVREKIQTFNDLMELSPQEILKKLGGYEDDFQITLQTLNKYGINVMAAEKYSSSESLLKTFLQK